MNNKVFWITYAVAVILDAIICVGLPFNEDNLILIAAMLLLLVTITIYHCNSKRVSFVNLIIMIAYSALLGYNLLFNSEHGAGFTWWFYLLMLSLVQFVTLVIYMIIKNIENWRLK
jgi:predicted neutral ceramidase superfamily lipid hydrolase